MKLYANQLSQILSSVQNKTVAAILFHGPNHGLASAIIQKIAKDFDFLTSKISYKEISAELLSSKLQARNFFGQRELIKIDDVTSSIDKKLKDTIADKSDNLACFCATDSLPPKGIRKFFEDNKNLLSVGCYYDDERTVSVGILKKITAAGKKIEEDALYLLKSNLKGDQLIIRNELDKLLAYTNEKSNIEANDVSACLSGQLLASGDEMCLHYANGRYEQFWQEIAKLRQQNINEVLIIRAMIRFYMNLYSTLKRVEDGENMDIAIKKLSPPFFFKLVPEFKSSLRNISSQDAVRMIDKLMKIEIQFKQNPKIHMEDVLVGS